MNLVEKKIGFKISQNQKIIELSPLSLKYFKLISKKINNIKWWYFNYRLWLFG